MEMQLTTGVLLFSLGIVGTIITLIIIVVYTLLARHDRRKLVEQLDAVYKK